MFHHIPIVGRYHLNESSTASLLYLVYILNNLNNRVPFESTKWSRYYMSTNSRIRCISGFFIKNMHLWFLAVMLKIMYGLRDDQICRNCFNFLPSSEKANTPSMSSLSPSSSDFSLSQGLLLLSTSVTTSVISWGGALQYPSWKNCSKSRELCTSPSSRIFILISERLELIFEFSLIPPLFDDWTPFAIFLSAESESLVKVERLSVKLPSWAREAPAVGFLAEIELLFLLIQLLFSRGDDKTDLPPFSTLFSFPDWTMDGYNSWDNPDKNARK